MKIKLTCSNALWEDNTGIQLCASVLSDLGLIKTAKYTLTVQKRKRAGFRKLNLYRQWNNGIWYWKIPRFTTESTEPNCFFDGEVDAVLNRMFPGKLKGTLYFKFTVDKSK